MKILLYYFSYVSNAIALIRQHFLYLTLAAETAATSIAFKTFHLHDFIGSHLIKYISTCIIKGPMTIVDYVEKF